MVVDTNVLASAAIASTGPVSAIVDSWIRYEFRVVTSAWILGELVRTFNKPYFSDQLPKEDIDAFLEFVQSRSEIVVVDIDNVPAIATQREDDYVLATALAGGARYLVTGDRMVRALDYHQGVQILTPREFAEVLGARS